MSVRSAVGVGGLLALGVYALLNYPSERDTPPPADRPDRSMPVGLVAVWDTNRDFEMTWTANGEHPPPEADRVSPWERVIKVRPGGTVTFTVRPLTGGKGGHHCIIEQPPGRPLPGAAQKTGYGTTAIMCTAVIGA